jgi:hypothetical protein
MVALKEKKGKENKERLTHIMCWNEVIYKQHELFVNYNNISFLQQFFRSLAKHVLSKVWFIYDLLRPTSV